MNEEKVFFNDSLVEVKQSTLIVGSDQYDMNSINFVNLVEEFGGFTAIGWLLVLVGIVTLPFYGVGFIIMLLAYVYFPSRKYAIRIMVHGKETDVLKSKNLEYIGLVKKAINDAINMSIANRTANMSAHSHMERSRV